MLLIALPTTIPCKLCLPCITPPCYKQDDVHTYASNSPGDAYSSASPVALARAHAALADTQQQLHATQQEILAME